MPKQTYPGVLLEKEKPCASYCTSTRYSVNLQEDGVEYRTVFIYQGFKLIRK